MTFTRKYDFDLRYSCKEIKGNAVIKQYQFVLAVQG
jgi:hypothetical protein